jgi:hypothetical protein
MMLSPSATFLSEGHAGLKTGFFVALQHNIGAMRIAHGFVSASGLSEIMTLFQVFIQHPPDVIAQSLTICAKFCRGPSCEIHVALPYAPLRGRDAPHALPGRFLPRLGPVTLVHRPFFLPGVAPWGFHSGRLHGSCTDLGQIPHLLMDVRSRQVTADIRRDQRSGAELAGLDLVAGERDSLPSETTSETMVPV